MVIDKIDGNHLLTINPLITSGRAIMSFKDVG